MHLKIWNDSQITPTGIPLKLQEILDCYRQMCEYASDNKIHTIYVLGDINDTKDIIHQRAFNLFSRLLDEFSDITHVLIHGNHDASKKESTESAIELLAGHNREILTKPQILGESISILPYSKHLSEDLQTLESTYLFGHLGVSEAQFSSGISLQCSISLKDLKRFKHVFLGHYHKPQTVGNITYIGSPIQTDKGQAGEIKRFIILNLETGETKSIPLMGARRYHKFEINEENYDNIKNILKEAKELREKGDFVETRCTLKEMPKIDKNFDLPIIHDYQKDINLRGITTSMDIEEQMGKYLEIENIAEEERESYLKIGTTVLNR